MSCWAPSHSGARSWSSLWTFSPSGEWLARTGLGVGNCTWWKFSFWEATWLLNVNDLVSIAFNHSLCVFVATILGKNHFYNFAAIFWISLQRGSTGGENVGKDCVQSKRRNCSEKVLFPHLSHNDRELLFVGSVCKQEVERPEWLEKMKIMSSQKLLGDDFTKTIICAKTY